MPILDVIGTGGVLISFGNAVVVTTQALPIITVSNFHQWTHGHGLVSLAVLRAAGAAHGDRPLRF